MSEHVASEFSLWPLSVKYQLIGDQNTEAVIQIAPGITTLVGPNGSGKTRALRATKSTLAMSAGFKVHNRKVHFLSAAARPVLRYPPDIRVCQKTCCLLNSIFSHARHRHGPVRSEPADCVHRPIHPSSSCARHRKSFPDFHRTQP